MKQLIANILKVALATLALLCVIQIVVSIRIHGVTVNGQDNLEQVERANADVIFIGNSRCLTTFVPSVFKTYGINGLNLGLHGHANINYILCRYRDYRLRDNRAPKIVVINLDPFSSSDEHADYRKDRFARYAFLPKVADTIMLNYFRFNFAERYIPAYAILKYRMFFDCILLNNRSEWVKSGMELAPHKLCESKDDSSFADQLFLTFRPKDRDSLLTSQLIVLRSRLAQDGVKLVAVQVPVYRKIYNARFEDTKRICASAGVPLLDFCDSTFDNDCSIFSDYDHLNKEGAMIISNLTARKIAAGEAFAYSRK